MTQGGPNNASTFYVYYLYTTAFTKSEMGYASALAWVLFVIDHGDHPDLVPLVPALGLLRDGSGPMTSPL